MKAIRTGLAALGRRLPTLIAGALAGLVAALVMILAMAASRYWLGIMPPVEAVPDRIAPLLDIDSFFRLFGKYGGYNGLKKFGIVSGLRAVVGIGVVVGIVYALIIESQLSRRSRRSLFGASTPAFAIMLAVSLLVWAGLVVFLWPVIPANYRGLPYSQARWATILALLVYILLFTGTLMVTYRAITSRAARWQTKPGDPPARPISRTIGRRAVLAGIGAALLTLPIYRILKTMYDQATFFYDGTVYSGEDIQPIAPVDRFYTVTKNVVDPDVNRDIWRLEIGGHVDHGVTLSFDDLMAYEQVDQETTLMCISNRIGAGLFSNANWRGVRMRDVLESAGVGNGAYEIVLTGADAYRDTFAIEKALEPTTLLVYQINGEPLPRIHGYPVRVLVPGMFGEKNVKWVTRIDVATKDEHGFYEQQGWGPNFMPYTRSDIFRPRTRLRSGKFTFTREFPAGQEIEIRGRAFAGNRGIRSVEISTDGGDSWRPVEIYYPGTKLTWALWRYTWTPPQAGQFVITSRAVDGNGDPQPEEVRGIVPQGASGYHKVTMTVT
ncbi:MAG TPA: molybdopterin-dependent oxidoreductase [Thermomicrobiales bacterium]|nr:molybdopterin-dependent oxidoreductase [Thermomicrobiales bacterium]